MSELVTYSNPKDLTEFLKKGKAGIEMALPKHLNADRMLRLAVTAFSTNSDLRNCTGMSILGSLIVAAQIGLEPGVAGQGYLIPYGRTCTFVPGWQGLVGLLNNSGRATAWTGAVFEGDLFEFELGSTPKCRHVPGENFGDPDKIQWVYACGKVNGSEQPVVEAWPMARVFRHRDKFNKVGRKHYSFNHPEMYARKVVLLQVLKYMPRSIELNNAIVAADAAEIGHATRAEGGIIIDMPTEPNVQQVSAPAPPRGLGAKAVNAPVAEPEKKAEPKAAAATLYEQVSALAKAAKVSEFSVLLFLDQNEMAQDHQELSEVHESSLETLIDQWQEVLPAIREIEARQLTPPEKAAAPSEEPAHGAEPDLIDTIRQKLAAAGIEEPALIAHLKKKKLVTSASAVDLTGVNEGRREWIAANFGTLEKEILGGK